MDKLYTIGYGIAKWGDFLKRLLDADISCIVDIRRAGSKSRNGKAFYWGSGPEGDYMGDRLFEAGIEYLTVSKLANEKRQSLRRYKRELENVSTIGFGNEHFLEGFCELLAVMRKFVTNNVCLLCCERDYQQCHRRIVAEVVGEVLDLEVVHL
jgi:hypothetical protein